MYLVGDGNSKIRKLGQLQLGSSLSQGKGKGEGQRFGVSAPLI